MNKPNPDTDLLRRAATQVRETAKAATPNVCLDWTWLAVRHVARNCDLECPTHGDDHEKCNQWDRYDDSPHMTLWHPGVALAVATWLEDVADLHEPHASAYGCDWCSDEDWPCADTRNALAVARALLGEDTE